MLLVTDDEIFNPAIRHLPTKELVMDLCRLKGTDHNSLKYSTKGKDFFIKYNNATISEAHAQLFFYSRINSNPNSSIRIPEIYHAWKEPDDKKAYIVMEYINIHHFASDEQRAQAITELISVTPPLGAFGGFNGERIQHGFFRDGEAPIAYSSTKKLEAFVNRVSATLC
jgi:hypothetical protein